MITTVSICIHTHIVIGRFDRDNHDEPSFSVSHVGLTVSASFPRFIVVFLRRITW
jgi:hypothetical protein